MAAKLKVTQVKSTISHIARNRGTVRALGLHGIGSTSIMTDNPATRGHGPPGALPRHGRGDRGRRERPTPRRRHVMKLHDLQPGRRVAQAAHARRPRHRRRQGQDRGPRHQGPEGACRRRHPALVRGRPDAAPHAHPEAARLQEPVQDRVRGRQHRRHRRARRARRVRVRGRPTASRPRPRRSRSTRTSCAPSGSCGPSTSRSRSSAPANCRSRSSSSPTRSPRPPERRSRPPAAASTSSRSRPRRSRRWA